MRARSCFRAENIYSTSYCGKHLLVSVICNDKLASFCYVDFKNNGFQLIQSTQTNKKPNGSMCLSVSMTKFTKCNLEEETFYSFSLEDKTDD